MQVRFGCPARGGSYPFDMPENTIHMTCSRTPKAIERRLSKGGDVKPTFGDGEPEPRETAEPA